MARYLDKLETEGLAGQLAGSQFRSVAWMVYLGVLPKVQNEWAAAIAASRATYDATLKEFIIDPKAESDGHEDIDKHNPLATDDDAPWQKYFIDTEFKKTIEQDVKRTFQEMEFFRDPVVQEELLNVLFCYSRSFPELAYRQGMHELAAIMYLVVYEDRARKDADEGAEPLSSEAANIMDQRYIAHDVYHLFSAVMLVCTDWFMQRQQPTRDASASRLQPMKDAPFGDDGAHLAPNSAIIRKLDRIHKIVLKRFDEELYNRLQAWCSWLFRACNGWWSMLDDVCVGTSPLNTSA
jgi:TBC1 domain family protein 5